MPFSRLVMEDWHLYVDQNAEFDSQRRDENQWKLLLRSQYLANTLIRMGPFWPLKSLDPDPSGNSLSIIVSIHVFYALFYGMLIINHLGRPKKKG